jgi:hypothetical protein
MDDPWNISPELEAIKSKLVQLGAGDHTGMFLSIIETAARQVSHPSTVKSPNRAPFKDTLDELNRLRRSLERGRSSEPKRRARLTELSAPARQFIQLELSRLQDSPLDLDTTDWSNANAYLMLMRAVDQARNWVRQQPGPARQYSLEGFCDSVALIYLQLTGKKPGVGGDPLLTNYATPCERLFLASLKLVKPNATVLQVREIFRRADRRR